MLEEAGILEFVHKTLDPHAYVFKKRKDRGDQ